MSEKDYIQGHAAACAAMLGHVARELYSSGLPEYERDRRLASLEAERAWAISMLRRVCAEYGDNDWPDNLSLSDIVEKHLWRCLEERAR